MDSIFLFPSNETSVEKNDHLANVAEVMFTLT